MKHSVVDSRKRWQLLGLTPNNFLQFLFQIVYSLCCTHRMWGQVGEVYLVLLIFWVYFAHFVCSDVWLTDTKLKYSEIFKWVSINARKQFDFFSINICELNGCTNYIKNRTHIRPETDTRGFSYYEYSECNAIFQMFNLYINTFESEKQKWSQEIWTYENFSMIRFIFKIWQFCCEMWNFNFGFMLLLVILYTYTAYIHRIHLSCIQHIKPSITTSACYAFPKYTKNTS